MTCDFRSRSPGLFDKVYDMFLLFNCAFSWSHLSLVSVSSISSEVIKRSGLLLGHWGGSFIHLQTLSFGEALCDSPPCLLPASRWLPLSYGSEWLHCTVYLVLRRKSECCKMLCLSNLWQAWLQMYSLPIWKPKWLTTSVWKNSSRFKGRNRCCCCACNTSAEPSQSQMLPELWKWNQVWKSSPLTKDTHYLKHPEHFCLFVCLESAGQDPDLAACPDFLKELNKCPRSNQPT